SLISRAAAPFAIAAGTIAQIAAMRRDPPACVAGFGGYPALPAMAAAVLLRRPRLIHEQNGVLGQVNRLLARRVDVLACGTWPTETPAGAQTVHAGNPVRAAVRQLAGTPYSPPADGPLRLLVIGGSQGAALFARTVPAALALLPPEV